MIAQTCTSCTIHGIDFSRLMYNRAKKYNKQYIPGKVQLQYGDFLKMPGDSNSYDKVFCLNVVYFWSELNEPFKKILSLLKKGGSFYIYMADKDALKTAPDSVFNKYSIEQVVESLKSARFSQVENYFDKGYYIKAKK